jgi:Circularly permutated YpsA SLOG family
VSRGVTKWAINVAKKIGKEICFIGLRSEWSKEKNKVRMWIKRNGVDNMRCAINGPRESEEPGIEGVAMNFCEALSDFLNQ